MLTTLLLALVFPQRASIHEDKMFEYVIGSRTGVNGYEELVDAAQLVSAPEFRESIKDMPRLGESDWLERHRKVAALSKKPFAKIRAGLAKPLRDPRIVHGYMALYPELAHFKVLTRAMVSQAAVSCADGFPDSAADILALGFRFARAVLANGSTIHFLVGIAMQSTLLSEFERSKWQMTPKGLSTLQNSLEPFEGHVLSRAVTLEFEGHRKDLEQLVNEPRAFYDAVGLKDDDYGQPDINLWLESTVAARKSKIGLFEQKWKEEVAALKVILTQPESSWGDSAEQFSPSLTAVEIPIIERPHRLLEGTLFALAQSQTRTRLAKLNCAILDYRWQHGLLPPGLASLKSDLCRDPRTGRDYHYELKGKRFKLWAEKQGGKGQITVARSEEEDGDDPTVVPPGRRNR